MVLKGFDIPSPGGSKRRGLLESARGHGVDGAHQAGSSSSSSSKLAVDHGARTRSGEIASRGTEEVEKYRQSSTSSSGETPGQEWPGTTMSENDNLASTTDGASPSRSSLPSSSSASSASFQRNLHSGTSAIENMESLSSSRATMREFGSNGERALSRSGSTAPLLMQEPSDDIRQLQPEQVCMTTGDNLSEYDKLCLQTCHTINDETQPRFYQWEDFCKKTSPDADWNEDCHDYYDCLLNCDIYKFLTRNGNLAVASKRPDLLEKMNPRSILDGEEKCDAEMCRSYCVRQTLPTCRELAFEAECEATKRTQRLMRCDTDCSSATRIFGSTGAGGMMFVLCWWWILMHYCGGARIFCGRSAGRR
ncbi:unnamed protein product [Amoebophrya sp. A25]|nr:unnamed protein product [Amoebophrya sp. A25]|eukprot:GSA25T00012279001.1